MSNLIRWDPYRETLTLRNMLDRWMDQAWTSEASDPASGAWGIALDVNENDDEYTVKASLPGVNPDDLEITFNHGLLTIHGETKEDQHQDEGRYHLRERRWGAFSRSLQLPGSIREDAIQADYDSGVLTLRLPKREEAKARKIEVKKEPKVIEGKLSESKPKRK